MTSLDVIRCKGNKSSFRSLALRARTIALRAQKLDLWASLMLLEYQVGASGQERGVAIKGGSYLPLAHGANFAEMFDEID